MAKIKFDDLMTKIGYVFKADSYIIDYQYIIGGEASEKDNPSNIILELTPDVVELLKEELPNKYEDFNSKSIFMFKNVKNAKKDFYENTKVISEKESTEIREKYIYLRDTERSINEWDTFIFSLEEIEDFVTNGKKFTLFSNDKNHAEVTISKRLIPMISLKNFNDLKYKPLSSKDQYSLSKLVLYLPVEYFNLFSIVEYLDVSLKDI